MSSLRSEARPSQFALATMNTQSSPDVNALAEKASKMYTEAKQLMDSRPPHDDEFMGGGESFLDWMASAERLKVCFSSFHQY